MTQNYTFLRILKHRGIVYLYKEIGSSVVVVVVVVAISPARFRHAQSQFLSIISVGTRDRKIPFKVIGLF